MTPNEEALPQEAQTEETIMEQPRRRIPAFAVVMIVGVLFVAGLLILMLIKPPQKACATSPRPT